MTRGERLVWVGTENAKVDCKKDMDLWKARQPEKGRRQEQETVAGVRKRAAHGRRAAHAFGGRASSCSRGNPRAPVWPRAVILPFP